jgi:hypothetical protein
MSQAIIVCFQSSIPVLAEPVGNTGGEGRDDGKDDQGQVQRRPHRDSRT